MAPKPNSVVAGLFLSVIVTAIPFTVNAQQTAAPSGIQVGPGYLYPLADVSSFHDDNLFNSVSGSELSTRGWKLSPNVTYELKDSIKRFAANWDLEAGFYDKSSDDDYVDNTLSAIYEYQPTSRFRGAVRGEYRDTHDPRGTGRAEGVLTGLSADPDEWHSYTANTSLAYGLADATARIEGDLGYVTKKYDNNLLSTAFRDRDDVLSAARFFYRVAPKTSLVVEGRYSTTDYQLDSPIGGTLNSDTYRILGGLTWDATAKTTGTIKVGYLEKKFDAVSRADGDSMNWEANIQWSPMTYSIVNLTTSRDFGETNGTGNFIETDTYSIDWTHSWADRISTTVDLAYAEDSFDPTTRQDERFYTGISLKYIMQRWLTLSGGYRYEDRDSNRDEFDYNKNLFMLTATVSL